MGSKTASGTSPWPYVPQHGPHVPHMRPTWAILDAFWADVGAKLGSSCFNFRLHVGRHSKDMEIAKIALSPRRESHFQGFAKEATNALKIASQAKLAPRALGSASGPRFWANLKPTCGQLGANLGQLAANLGLHRPTWGQLAANFGLLGVNLGQLGAILPELGPTWAIWRPTWGQLHPNLGQLGGKLALTWR